MHALAGRLRRVLPRQGLTLSQVIDAAVERFAAREAIVCGEDRITYGELGERVETLSLEELNAHLMGKRIAKFKLPERLEVVEAFPISPAGKILRRHLRERIEAKLAAERAGTG